MKSTGRGLNEPCDDVETLSHHPHVRDIIPDFLTGHRLRVTAIPSYIEYQCRPHHTSKAIQQEIPISNVRTPVESGTTGPSTPFTCMDAGTQPLIYGGTRPRVSQIPRSMNSLDNPGLVQSSGIFKISDNTSADARVLGTTSPVDVNTQSITSADALSHQNFNSQGKFIGSQTLEKTWKRNSGSDWLTAGTLSLDDASLYETTGEFSRSPENTRLRHGWSGHTFHSPFRLSTGLCTTQDGGTKSNIRLASARNDFRVILPNGGDPEEIVTSLRLARAHLLMSSDGTMLNRNFSRGSTRDSLRHLLCSGWLLNELENLLCWSYEASARAIRQRQLAKNGALEDTYSKRSEIHNDNHETLWTEAKLHRRSSALSGPQIKLTSTWSSHMPNSTVNIRLRTVTSQHLILDDKESPSVLEMYSIPIAAHRTRGISAIFVNPLAEKQCHGISPQIRTFNVVPEGSEIIQCVRNNDLRGVQNLFDQGKASPSDVDPRGFSLLSASALRHSNQHPLPLTILVQSPTFVTFGSECSVTDSPASTLCITDVLIYLIRWFGLGQVYRIVDGLLSSVVLGYSPTITDNSLASAVNMTPLGPSGHIS